MIQELFKLLKISSTFTGLNLQYVSSCLSDSDLSDVIGKINLIQRGLTKRELSMQQKEEEIN